MNRAAELLEGEIPVVAELLTSEMGKTFAAAKGEAAKCAMTMRYYAEHAQSMLETRSSPRRASLSGVRYEPIRADSGDHALELPALAVDPLRGAEPDGGQRRVLKHASNVPGARTILEDLFVRAGFAKGVVTKLFVEVDRLPRIIADPRVAGVTLTGSERAGRAVAETRRPAPEEVAYSSSADRTPSSSASSADMDAHGAARAVTARIQNNGQSCIASKRFIVVRERAEEFIERFVEAMAAVPTGDPMDPATVLGPVVSRGQLDELTAQVGDSVAKGAGRAGGAPLAGRGFFFPATVLTDVPADSRAGCEELFGPVAVVRSPRTSTPAIEFANATPWGLGGSVCASRPREIDAAIDGLDVGMVFANAIVASMPELPFGGTKKSGFGRELSASTACASSPTPSPSTWHDRTATTSTTPLRRRVATRSPTRWRRGSTASWATLRELTAPRATRDGPSKKLATRSPSLRGRQAGRRDLHRAAAPSHAPRDRRGHDVAHRATHDKSRGRHVARRAPRGPDAAQFVAQRSRRATSLIDVDADGVVDLESLLAALD